MSTEIPTNEMNAHCYNFQKYGFNDTNTAKTFLNFLNFWLNFMPFETKITITFKPR